MKSFILMMVLIFSSQVDAVVVPTEAYTFGFNIKTIRMERQKEAKLDKAVMLLQEVFASPEFKKRILSHRFNGKRRFAMNKGLSNAEIYRRIIKGVERLHPYANNAMDVEIELYSDYNSIVLGFTNPRSKRIWMNRKYFNKHSPAKLASHLTHEWLHKLGFDHEREKCHNRKYSVPYAVGYIVKDIAKNYEAYYQKRQKKR